ncbi:IQ calmodulin-binding motif family protein, partial [Tribonema minus]
LAAPLVGAAERLNVLLRVKWAVRGFECRLTRELVELLDREADLLSRGRAARSMAGLRLRACGLFLRFIETPDFNPEASRFLRAVPSHQHLAVAAAKQLVGIAC